MIVFVILKVNYSDGCFPNKMENLIKWISQITHIYLCFLEFSQRLGQLFHYSNDSLKLHKFNPLMN